MSVPHDPSWPDKAMFAALVLALAGALGTAFELARGHIAVNEDRLLVLFSEEVPYYTLALSLATLVLGVVCLRTQAAVFGYLGSVAAIASFGFFGTVSVLGLVAVGLLVKSRLEGEETRNDGIRLHSSQWPDKAMAASLALFIGAAVSATQGFTTIAGSFGPVFAFGPGWLAPAIDLTVAALLLVASHQVYRLRRPWLGVAAAAFGIATLGLYLFGPLLGIAALVLLRLAQREGEFAPEPVARAQAHRRRSETAEAATRRAT